MPPVAQGICWNGLTTLLDRPVVGEVRGPGLMLVVELAEDKEAKDPGVCAGTRPADTGSAMRPECFSGGVQLVGAVTLVDLHRSGPRPGYRSDPVGTRVTRAGRDGRRLARPRAEPGATRATERGVKLHRNYVTR